MMPRAARLHPAWWLSVLAGLLAAGIFAARSCRERDDVSAIVAKHLDACGGIAQLRAMSATRETGTVTVAGGEIQTSGPYMLEEKRPNKSRLERGLGRGEVDVRAYDGSTAWSLTGLRLEVLQGESARSLAENDFDSVFLDSSSRGITISLVGSARVGEASAYKLLVDKRGAARYSYIDK